MPRRSATGKNRWTYEGRPRYNPEVEGYGNPQQWRGAFNERMGFEEAERIKNQAGANWRSEYILIGEIASVPLNENSLWDEIKSAFRKASMNCHPDRIKTTGLDPKVAEETFKQVSAAYVILAHKYGKD